MPFGEISVEQLSNIFSGKYYLDFVDLIPIEILRSVSDKNEFESFIDMNVKNGLLKVSYYVEEDSRFDNKYSGIKKMRIHKTVQKLIEQNYNFDGFEKEPLYAVINSIKEKMT